MFFRAVPILKKHLVNKQAISMLKSMCSTTAATLGVASFMEYSIYTAAQEMANAASLNDTDASNDKKILSTQIILPSEEKIRLSGIPKEQFEQYGMIAIQAAKNLGLNRSVMVVFQDAKIEALAEKKSHVFTTMPSGANATCVSFFNHSLERGAYFTINYDIIKKNTPEEMYAVAGHEALHALENHSFQHALFLPIFSLTNHLIREYSPKILSRFPILWSIYLTVNIQHLISQYLEYRADTISSSQLGSAKHLAQFLSKSEEINKEEGKAYVQEEMKSRNILPLLLLTVPYLLSFSRHPSDETRLKYLEETQKKTGYVDKLSLFSVRRDPDVKIRQEKGSASAQPTAST